VAYSYKSPKRYLIINYYCEAVNLFQLRLLIIFGPNMMCTNKKHIQINSRISNQYAKVPKTLNDEDKK